MTIGQASLGVALGLLLGGCGQQGALYLPTDAAAANRATLPQTLLPKSLTSHAATPAAAPAATPSTALAPAPTASASRP